MSTYRSNLEAFRPSGVVIAQRGEEIVLQNALCRNRGTSRERWFDIPITMKGPRGKPMAIRDGARLDPKGLKKIAELFKGMVDTWDAVPKEGQMGSCSEFTCFRKGTKISVSVTRLGREKLKKGCDVSGFPLMKERATEIMRRMLSSSIKAASGRSSAIRAKTLEKANRATKASARTAFLALPAPKSKKHVPKEVAISEQDSDEESCEEEPFISRRHLRITDQNDSPSSQQLVLRRASRRSHIRDAAPLPLPTRLNTQEKRFEIMDVATDDFKSHKRWKDYAPESYSALAQYKGEPQNEELASWREALEELISHPKSAQGKAAGLKFWLQCLYHHSLPFWMCRGDEHPAMAVFRKPTMQQKERACHYVLSDLNIEEDSIEKLKKALI